MKSPAHKESVNEKLQSVANVADNVVISASFSTGISARSANRVIRSGQWVFHQTSHKIPFRFYGQTFPWSRFFLVVGVVHIADPWTHRT